MKKKKKYYKVLAYRYATSTNDKILVSVNGHVSDTWRVEYKLNECVTPKVYDTRLYVFDSLENAEDFQRSEGGDYIYECEVKNPRPDIVANFRQRNIEIFWETIKLARRSKKSVKVAVKSLIKDYVPRGTISCTEVKLTKLIRSYN